jgi:uncharacterized membrane protein (UPF0127 family)
VWLVRDGEVLAAAERPATRRGRAKGLLRRNGIEGAIVLAPCRQVHTLSMRFAIDVAFLDRDGVVLRICTLRPWRISPLVWRAQGVVEAEAAAFDRWQLRVGDRIELKP